MAIAFDAAASVNGAGSTTYTFSLTTSGSDRAIFFSGGGPSSPVSAVDYAGDAATQLWSRNTGPFGSSLYGYGGYLVNPAIGTNTVTFTTTIFASLSAGAIAMTGVAQTGTVGTPVTNDGYPSTAATITISSATGKLVCAGISTWDFDVTPAAGQDERWQNTIAATSSAGDTKPGATSVTLDWTLNPNVSAWNTGAVSFNPSTGGNVDFDIDAGAMTIAGQSIDFSIAVPISPGAMTIAGQSIVFSMGSTVPDVVGDSQAAGTTAIQGAGFVVSVQYGYSATVPAGDIISQDPVGGSAATPGSTVIIVVSSGTAPAAGSNIRDGRRRGRVLQLFGRG